MKTQYINSILAAVPDYKVFLTIDELLESSKMLAAKFPDVVTILPLGTSRDGDLIEVIKIGNGANNALIFAMPHPNEPIGSMMLEYLSSRLAEDSKLRDAFDYTWYLIKSVDPDGTRLNEGWFKGPFTITNYGRNFFRPPSHLQVEWTFPIEYKSLKFLDPLPETQALMFLIEEIKPEFIYSLHNAGFGGAYFYISEDALDLRNPFFDLVDNQGLNLHLGEPEVPWVEKYADAIFQTPSITQAYDFMEAQGVDPSKVITGGTSSWDYAKQFCDPFSLLCELPYFYNETIHDTSDSDQIRRDVILSGVSKIRNQFQTIIDIFTVIEEELTSTSPYRDAISSLISMVPQNLTATENWAKSDPNTESVATKAEKFDNLFVRRFYYVLLNLGMTIRMIEHQISMTGPTQSLSSALDRAIAAFEEVASELEEELKYSVIPIQKLVRVQLGSALLSAAYAAERKKD